MLVDKEIDQKYLEYGQHLTIGVVGKVSCGKSSLLNAIFEKTREDKKFEVAATSGTTTKSQIHEIGPDVTILDTAGLLDCNTANSEKTKKILSKLDLGLFIISGSADKAQVDEYKKLKENCEVFVVFNRVDEYDRKKKALDKVIEQWASYLDVDANTIYRTCAAGYDDDDEGDLDLRVQDLQAGIFKYLQNKKKLVLLAHLMKKKLQHAMAIIVPCVLLCSGLSLLPLSFVSITAAQVSAIAALNYLYHGKWLSKSELWFLAPSIASGAVGKFGFLAIKSFFPPTIYIDVIAASVALSLTASILVAVLIHLHKGLTLDNAFKSAELQDICTLLYKKIAEELKNASLKDLQSKEFWTNMLHRFAESLLDTSATDEVQKH